MKTAKRRSALVCVGLAVCHVLVAAAAQAQDVSFEVARNSAAGRQPYSVAVGDFNGDGVQDLAVANSDSDNVSVLLGNGDGSFLAPQDFDVGERFPVSVAVGDFNGDGVQDVAVANFSHPIPFNQGNVGVLLGNGDGSFQAPGNFAAGGGPSSVAVGDFNGDGVHDLAVANLFSDKSRCFWATGTGASSRRKTSVSGIFLSPLRWGTSMEMGCWTWPWPPTVPTMSRC